MSQPSNDSSLTTRLLHDCQADRAEAFEYLFARHRKRLKLFVTRRMDPALAARLDASDVVQETQTVMFARLSDYLDHPPMPFRTWAVKTALDCLGKARRTHILTDKRSVRHEVTLPDASSYCLAEHVLASSGSLSDKMCRRETTTLVQRALESLNAVDREVLLMRHLDGLGNQEIADILDLTSDAVSKRHGRALVRLHDCLSRLDRKREDW